MAEPTSRWGEGQAPEGAAAEKQALLEGLARCRVAHLATHGFFAEGSAQPQLPAQSEALLAFRGDAVVTRPAVPVLARNPLLASSLVLAGANRGGELGSGEGLLTA